MKHNVQHLTQSSGRCPAHGQESSPAVPAAGEMPAPLWSAGQVAARPAELPGLAVTLDWVHRFLDRPHPALGRTGAVCPFVGGALKLDTLWLAQIPGRRIDRETLVAWAGSYRDVFLALKPTDEEGRINKAIVLVFPDLDQRTAGDLISGVQRDLKPRFVAWGLMIGEFFAGNDTPGLRNPDFRPLASPLPMLAIRHMVESDLPFLARTLDTAEARSRFLRSYLRRLGQEAKPHNFDTALEALVDAEVERRRGGCPVHAKPGTEG